MHRGWIVGLLVLIVVVAVGAAIGNNAYQAGLAQGLAQSASPAEQPRPLPYYYGPWGYGHGFGFFGFFGFLLFLFLIFGLIRALFFWGRGGPGHWHRGPGGGTPPWFEEWHRRAHEPKPEAPRGTTV